MRWLRKWFCEAGGTSLQTTSFSTSSKFARRYSQRQLLPKVVGILGMVLISAQAGIDNNNPGNIRTNSIRWNGSIPSQGPFVHFSTPEDGIRAMARILRVYSTKYKLTTIRGIVTRWAPPIENDTQAYIRFVSKKLDKKPDEKLNIGSDVELAKLITAIIHQENGRVPYDEETILRGIRKP